MLTVIVYVFLYRCRTMRSSSGSVKRVGLAQQIIRKSTGRFPFAGEIVNLYKADKSAREVANELGVSKSHVLRILNKAGIVRPQAVAQHLAAKKKRGVARNSTATDMRSITAHGPQNDT